MEKDNILTYRVYGKRALFSDPITRVGGEKFSYQVPTYQALKGITESIYWKPTLMWKIRKVRILNPIQTISQGIRPIVMSGGNTLSYYTYLSDVDYEVEVQMLWNENRQDLEADRNENKHYFMAKRMIERGGRRDVFLGTRECQAYVESCEFGKEKGHYDELANLSQGLMFHSFVYPDEAVRKEEQGQITALFWRPEMKKGIIDFIEPNDCTTRKPIHKMSMKEFTLGMNVSSIHHMEGVDEV